MSEEDCGSDHWRMWKIGSRRIRDPSNDRDPGDKCLRSIQQLSFWIQGTLSFGKEEGLFVNYVTQIRAEGLTLLFCQGIKMGRAGRESNIIQILSGSKTQQFSIS